jgi:hypothetical protein
VKNSITINSDINLAGIEDIPAGYNKKLPLIIFLNGGIISNMGPNRLYFRLSEQIVSYGFSTFRFNFSNLMNGSESNLSFEEQQVKDTQMVLDYYEKEKKIEQFILIGICSGSDVAYRTSLLDKRVTGFISINGQFINNTDLNENYNTLKRIHDKLYYRKNILNFERWKKVFTSKSGVWQNIRKYNNIKGYISGNNANLSRLQDKIAWPDDKLIYLIFSEGSVNYVIYKTILEKKVAMLCNAPKSGCAVTILKNIDHNFTLLCAQEQLSKLVLKWLISKFER